MNEKRLILVIEDEHAISNFICRALAANDYKAIPASSGKEGLSLFFSHSPDLVLLDLGLPDMDGLEVLEQLSDLPERSLSSSSPPVTASRRRFALWTWGRMIMW